MSAPAGSTTPAAGWFYGWLIAGLSVLLYFFSNGLTVFVPQGLAPRLVETFNATPAEIARTTALTFLVTSLTAPLAGALVDRVGVLPVLRSGMVLLGLAFAGYPLASSLTHLYLLHVLFGGGLACAGLLVNVVLLSNWFVARRGLVVGALVAGSSLAGSTLLLAIAPLIADPALGWRYGYGVLAAAFWLLAVLPASLLLREQPADVGQLPDGARIGTRISASTSAPPAAATLTGVTLRRALRSTTLWCLALGSACLWFSIQSVVSQLTLYLEREAGFTQLEAIQVFSLAFALSFFGKFLFGAASDWFAKRHVMLAASLTLLAGTLLLFDNGAASGGLRLTDDAAQLRAFAVVFGLGFGGSFTMIQLTVVESFGQRDLGKILGMVIFVDGIAGAAGPLVAGELATRTGSYLPAFMVVAAVTALAVVNVLFIRPVPPD